jgi:phage shock protein C
MLAGVAAGVAETLDADPSLVRILWALLAIFSGGIAVIVYIVMAIVVPEAPEEPWPSPPASPSTPTPGPTTAPTRAELRAARRAGRRARRRRAVDSGEAGLILGVVLIVIGGLFLLRQAFPWFGFHLWWPIAVIALGVFLIVVALRPRPPSE